MAVTTTAQTARRRDWTAILTIINLAILLLLVFIERVVAERHWLATLPVMRIDFIFAGKGFAAFRCRRPAITASDHYPVLAEVMLVEGVD